VSAAGLLFLATVLVPAAPPPAGPQWDLPALQRAPAVFPATNRADGVTACFYAGLPYHGQPTRVFAFHGLPPAAATGTRVPGVVLVHGGGGTAFAEWVRLWTGRGYAAIAMDLCGSVPVGTYGNWQRHPDGGPPGWGGFDQIQEPPADQWSYHAVADILLGHSLLAQLPGVDPKRIGITGISWGGYLTCIAAGVDPRFRCAVPVYGCGFLGENSAWLGDFERLGPGRAARWLAWWDPSAYLPDARLPILWLNGSNDFAYPMDSWQRSYRRAPGPRTVCLKVRMPHAHGGAGENPLEIHAFMNTHLRGDPPLARVTGQGRDGSRVWAVCRGRFALHRAELNFTRSTGRWQDRVWETVPAGLDPRRGRAEAELPADTQVWYLNFIDSRGIVVSTEHEVLPGAG
jgi:dienelactone hydrolase